MGGRHAPHGHHSRPDCRPRIANKVHSRIFGLFFKPGDKSMKKMLFATVSALTLMTGAALAAGPTPARTTRSLTRSAMATMPRSARAAATTTRTSIRAAATTQTLARPAPRAQLTYRRSIKVRATALCRVRGRPLSRAVPPRATHRTLSRPGLAATWPMSTRVVALAP